MNLCLGNLTFLDRPSGDLPSSVSNLSNMPWSWTPVVPSGHRSLTAFRLGAAFAST
jgi:hypothetical protein